MFLLASFNYGALDAKIVCHLEVSSGLVESICIPHLLIRLQMVLKTFIIFHLTIADLFSVVMYSHAQNKPWILSRHFFPVNLGYNSEVAIRKNKGKLPNFSDHKLQKRGKTSKWSHTTAYISATSPFDEVSFKSSLVSFFLWECKSISYPADGDWPSADYSLTCRHCSANYRRDSWPPYLHRIVEGKTSKPQKIVPENSCTLTAIKSKVRTC